MINRRLTLHQCVAAADNHEMSSSRRLDMFDDGGRGKRCYRCQFS
jgi:hypothetical protein